MCENKCCGTCEHYSPYSNISSSNGTCKEYEALVYYYKSPCGWYCKKMNDNNYNDIIAKQRKEDESNDN